MNDKVDDISRRQLLEGALHLGAVTIGASALVACDASASASSEPATAGRTTAVLEDGAPYRVDVHCHHIPDFYRLSLTRIIPNCTTTPPFRRRRRR
ncbi:hypothetical protein LZC95_32450 [Pendulispora brunnea]|uniref:Amidohydrolase n=1 Tax=Pendulispora brunnea TaxID=2905690 RepID=A0ABZ2JXF2_9BACT